jgi:hypothetical protein
MTPDQRLALILSFVSVIGIPTLAFSFRFMTKWTRVESRMEELVRSMARLVDDKDKVHTAIQQEIRDDRASAKDDRAATDRRLRWLEEHLWGKERNRNG